MSFITRGGAGAAAEQEFERALVDSARADELPAARTEQAWARFAGAMAGLPDVSGGTTARADVPTATVMRAPGAVSRWLLLGALGGGAVTAAFIAGRGGRGAAPMGPSDAPASSESPGLVLERARIAPAELTPSLGLDAPQPPRWPGKGGLRRPTARVRVAKNGEAAPSTLAAEVSALDAARKAGDPDATLRLVDRYQYDFPDGELAADAEVVAIEALAAKGEGDEAARRAARFLARYPNDPHAAEVRRLARGR